MVAAVLHIGNIDFAKGKEIDSSVIKDEKSRFHLKTASDLLMYVHKLRRFTSSVKSSYCC